MYQNSAEFYDKIYKWKDYKTEAEKVCQFIENHCPEAHSILDVACGTHEHAKYLTNSYSVDGLDLNKTFLDHAKRKNPDGSYYHKDMIKFSIGKKYDVVMSLFSSIGYAKTLENLRSTIVAMASHTKIGGLVLVEPWFTPEKWKVGHVNMVVVDEPELKVCRMNMSEMIGTQSFIRFHYLVAENKQGVQSFTEEHQLGLFTKDQMMDAMRSANLDVELNEYGLFGRGLYIGRVKDTEHDQIDSSKSK